MEANDNVFRVTPSVDVEYDEEEDEELEDDDQEEQEEDIDSPDDVLLRLLVHVESPIDSLSKFSGLYSVEGDIGKQSRLLFFLEDDRYHWKENLTGLLLYIVFFPAIQGSVADLRMQSREEVVISCRCCGLMVLPGVLEIEK
jgi:hypothetical protein